MIYEVGRYYRVPTVQGIWGGGNKPQIWPILGPWHEDREYIGFPEEHYHFDFRFLSDRQMAILGYPPHNAILHNFAEHCGGKHIGPVVMRRRKCKRAMPLFPLSGRHGTHHFPKLHEAYKDSRLGPNLQCPHKGVSLANLEPLPTGINCGILVCPLHGLCFDAESHRAIAPQEAQRRLREFDEEIQRQAADKFFNVKERT